MNIELQCCGLFMSVVLLVLFLGERSLNLSSRKLFFKALLACIACLVLDIASIVAIHETLYGTFPPIATEAICKLYICALIAQGYSGFLYTANEFFANHARSRIRIGYNAWFIAGWLGVILLPISYLMEGRVVYSYGPAVYFAYVIVFGFIGSSIYMAYRGANRSSKRRRRTILLWQSSWFIAGIIQLLKPDLLVAGFAVAFGIFITYAELENPREGIDRTTGHFTASALAGYLNDLYRHGRPFSALCIRVEYRVAHVSPDTEKRVMLQLGEFLGQAKKACLFRTGDDEFMVIYDNAQQMQADYERISSGIDDALDLPARLRYLLIPYSSIMDSADEFLRSRHYFEQLASGQDCSTIDQAAVDDMRRYYGIQEMISAALDEGRVEVFYQPIYNVEKQRFTSAEALVRIRDVDGSLVMPGVFIPVAEENGQIVQLGQEVLRQTCAFLATGKAQALGLEYVEVNLSVAQFDEENPASLVLNAIEHYRIQPSEINLEITETASNSAKRVLAMNMSKLIDRGVSFSLDDFGTGRSNLDYFVDMPVSIIKFDYSFTQGYFKTEKARYVVESVVSMMNRINMPIVAEGVETAEQLQAMEDLGISFIQGFYFSRPIPQNEFLQFLEEHN